VGRTGLLNAPGVLWGRALDAHSGSQFMQRPLFRSTPAHGKLVRMGSKSDPVTTPCGDLNARLNLNMEQRDRQRMNKLFLQGKLFSEWTTDV
jgi:hypothetical protein